MFTRSGRAVRCAGSPSLLLMPSFHRASRLLALLALPLLLASCDSSADESDKGCFSRPNNAPEACLTITDTVVGTGVAANASARDSVFVRYVGRVQGSQSNAEFDRGAFGFQLREGQVVPGFYYAIAGAELEGVTRFDAMKVGGKRTVTIPAELGYGDQEVRGANGFVLIPRNSTLVFEIELTNVKPRQ